MENNKRISELLVETKAYQDLDKPVILTSGELGIYYINTEKLVQDNGEFEKYGDDSQAMIQHAVKMTKEHPTFNEVIDIMTESVENLIDLEWPEWAISGGQRRDWLFSGPIAKNLDLEHISLYKDGKIEVIRPSGEIYDAWGSGHFFHFSDTPSVIHIADLLTEGSSVYREENGKAKGWVPSLREKGMLVNDLVTVVTRKQGGEEILDPQGIRVRSFVSIDENFLRQYSKNPDRAVNYLKNPKEWNENYLKENGALALIKSFDPAGGKLDRARKFLNRYVSVLQGDRIQELEHAAEKEYGKSLTEILEVKK